LFYVIAVSINTSICPTQSWNIWSLGYNKLSSGEMLKQVLPYSLPLCFILTMIAYFMFAI